MAIYFASDLHLGYDEDDNSSEHERKIVSWLRSIESLPATLYFIGDTFDYWFEFGNKIPDHSRLFLSQINKMIQNGWEIHLLTGNHDLWLKDVLPTKYGVKIHAKPLQIEHYSKRIYLHHGDGIGKGDYSYKFIKYLFSNPFLQWLFGLLPSKIGFKIMKKSSSLSRKNHTTGSENLFEKHYDYCKQAELKHIDYFIMGHLHKPIAHKLNDQQVYHNLGDWFGHTCYYARLDENGIMRCTFEAKK